MTPSFWLDHWGICLVGALRYYICFHVPDHPEVSNWIMKIGWCNQERFVVLTFKTLSWKSWGQQGEFQYKETYHYKNLICNIKISNMWILTQGIPSVGILITKIRRSWDRLIFIMGIPKPRKTVLILKCLPGLASHGITAVSVVPVIPLGVLRTCAGKFNSSRQCVITKTTSMSCRLDYRYKRTEQHKENLAILLQNPTRYLNTEWRIWYGNSLKFFGNDINLFWRVVFLKCCAVFRAACRRPMNTASFGLAIVSAR